jgi:hypothetical protein
MERWQALSGIERCCAAAVIGGAVIAFVELGSAGVAVAKAGYGVLSAELLKKLVRSSIR